MQLISNHTPYGPVNVYIRPEIPHNNPIERLCGERSDACFVLGTLKICGIAPIIQQIDIIAPEHSLTMSIVIFISEQSINLF
jgi:hypothetical protein